MKNLCLLLAILLTNNLAAQNTYVFTGSYNWDKNTKGIYVFQLDTTTGKLDSVLSYTGIANPSFITLSPNGRVLYACTESKTPGAGSVSAFAFDPVQKTLTFINSQPSGGENPVYVNVYPNGKWLVNANYTEGSVAVYPINNDGSIAPAVQHISYTEKSIDPERQDKSHVHAAIFSSDGRYVYFPDLGADIIRGYPFDSTKDKPLNLSGIVTHHTVPGSGPRHLAFHPNGQFAYCTEEMAGYISVYKYNNGKLDSMQRISAHQGNEKPGYESSDIHVSPDGRFLYAANRGKENNIAIYAIAKDGRLHFIGYQSTYGQHPRNFTIDAAGRFLIVANVVSGNIVVFKRDSKTGRLKMTGTAGNLKNPTSVQIGQY
ncbi:lactonase family protein [Chitinophaga sp.]|uniref:lactonase family protein n=1 Tax=Chitinophaga sp. TaxID=1869181 RepID=UPI0031DC7B84